MHIPVLCRPCVRKYFRNLKNSYIKRRYLILHGQRISRITFIRYAQKIRIYSNIKSYLLLTSWTFKISLQVQFNNLMFFYFQNNSNLRTGLIIFLCMCIGLPLGLLKNLSAISKASTLCICFYSVFVFYVSMQNIYKIMFGHFFMLS